MRCYTKQHQFYCGIDLHARTMYLCIMDHEGTIHLHRNLPATTQALADALQPYCHDLALAARVRLHLILGGRPVHPVGVELVLGHALYMKAIHGGKVKNDKIDSRKIAALLRSGMLPMAYVYPQAMRLTRDLLRRRLYLSRQHAQLV
jgi:hypothetical protein